MYKSCPGKMLTILEAYVLKRNVYCQSNFLLPTSILVTLYTIIVICLSHYYFYYYYLWEHIYVPAYVWGMVIRRQLLGADSFWESNSSHLVCAATILSMETSHRPMCCGHL